MIEGEMHAWFATFDENRDGKVSLDEFLNFFKKLDDEFLWPILN